MKEKNGNSSDKAIEKSVSGVVWDLSDLYGGAGDKKIKADINKGLKLADEFKNEYGGKMNKIKKASEFAEMFVRYEKCLEILNKFMQFSFLNLSLDTSSPEAKSLLSHAEEKCAEIENKLLFFRLELCGLEEAAVNKFKKSKELANYAHQIDVIRAFKPYQLSEKEEQIINIKNLNAKNYVVQLYDEFTASFRFKVKMPDGKITEMNGSQLRNLRYHQSQEMRKQSYELYMEKYNENLLVITGFYNMIVRDHAQENKLRGFKRADEPRNIANEIDNKVIDALIEVTTKNSNLVHRYYKLKAKMLKVKKLNLYDIYAPTASVTKKFDWNEAKAIVLESFKNFDPSFHKIASDFFNNKWIDAKIGENKKSGAYCSSSVPGLHPFVLMNYTGNLREVMTLAHELGHAIHAVLSSKNTILNYHAILPLCETASIFAESVVNDDLLKKLKNRDEKITLLTSKLEDFFATSFRQNMFTRFEQEAHKQSADKLLSPAGLNAIYEKELKIMFGDSVTITKDNFVEWSVIPHIFHTPFYCYSYNFALLLVLALYQSYCEKGEKFKPGFLKLLSSGSSVTPGEMLEYVGIDISDKKFWQKGFDYISSKIDELEGLLK
jgi:oligoendopeptidase F